MAQESLNLPYIVLSGTLLLSLIVSFLVFKPQFEDWRAAQGEITRLTMRLHERQVFLIGIDQKTTELRSNAAYDQELTVMLPTDESFDDVLRIIDRQAAAAGVQIRNVDNETANTQVANRVAQALGNSSEVADNLIIHGVGIKLQGSYQQIRQFVSHLENAARFMDIVSLGLTQPGGQTDVLEGTLSTKFYSLSPRL